MTYTPSDSDDDGIDDDVDAITDQSASPTEVTAPVDNTDTNNVLWADDPDDIQTQINNLPTHGGVVKLKPGTYTDSDWSQRIDIPANSSLEYLGVDMSGSEITLTSFAPTDAYIKKPKESSIDDVPAIEFRGPFADVSGAVGGLTSPPAWVWLDDVENATIYQPKGFGKVSAVYHNEQYNGSGHMNRVKTKWGDAVRGYEIIADPANASNDRSFYAGQLLRLEDAGVHLKNAKNNFFWVQPESSKTGFTAVGYRADPDCAANRFNLVHGAIDIPFDVEGEGHQLRNSWGLTNNILPNSKLNIPPRAIETSANMRVSEFDFGAADWRSVLSTPGGGSTSIGNFGRVTLDAGTSGGTRQAIETISRPSRVGGADHQQIHIRVNETTNIIVRVGTRIDDNNRAMLEADPANDANWRAIIDEGGTRQVDIDTGVAFSSTNYKFRQTAVSGNYQWFEGTNHIAESTYSSSFGVPQKTRVEVEVVGSPSSARTMSLYNFEVLYQE